MKPGFCSGRGLKGRFCCGQNEQASRNCVKPERCSWVIVWTVVNGAGDFAPSMVVFADWTGEELDSIWLEVREDEKKKDEGKEKETGIAENKKDCSRSQKKEGSQSQPRVLGKLGRGC